MYFSIENRSPFLDRALFEFCFQIPTRHLIRDGAAKAVLREAMRGIVPDAILDNRRKVGFNAADSFVSRRRRPRGAVASCSTTARSSSIVRRDRIEPLLDKATLPNSESKFLFYFREQQDVPGGIRGVNVLRPLRAPGHAARAGARRRRRLLGMRSARREENGVDRLGRAAQAASRRSSARRRRAAAATTASIPVSGGKDSTWQVVKCLEYGLRSAGGDVEDAGANRRSGSAISTTWCGSASTTSTTRSTRRSNAGSCTRRLRASAITACRCTWRSSPSRCDSRWRSNMPLVVWGENSAHRVRRHRRGPRSVPARCRMAGAARRPQGTSVDDWIDDDLTAQGAGAVPSAPAMPRSSAAGDPLRSSSATTCPGIRRTSLRVARANGFEARAEGPKVGYYDYADID